MSSGVRFTLEGRMAAEDLPMREGVDFEPLLGLLIPGKETV